MLAVTVFLSFVGELVAVCCLDVSGEDVTITSLSGVELVSDLVLSVLLLSRCLLGGGCCLLTVACLVVCCCSFCAVSLQDDE